VCLVLTLATPAAAQSRVSRCWAACERNVTDPRLRASACGACLTSPEQGAAWLSRLPSPPEHLLEDPDWEVRWAGLLAQARLNKSTAPRELAKWLRRAQGEEVDRACLTALHAAGSLKTPMATLLGAPSSGDPKAAKTCTGRSQALTEALWLDLYSLDAPARREALTHLAHGFERAPARVVLDALPSHPPAFDEQVLECLASWSLEANVSPAASLLAAATQADVAVMNRVLAVYARQRDEARAQLGSTEEPVRRQAVSRLMELAPISEPELLGVLSDPRPSFRLMAARGLARGEARTLAQLGEARFSGARPATPEQQRALLELIGDKHEPDCAPTLLETWRDAARAPELRARALVVAASCSWTIAAPAVETALAGTSELERSASVAALGFAPRTEQLTERLARATDAPEPSVRRAACQAIGQQRWRAATPRLSVLASDADPGVRAEALQTLVALDAPGLEAKLTAALEKDPAPAVRASAAGLLARFAGARVLSALGEAARNDTDPNVKLVAAQSLRKLSPGSLPP